MALKTSTAGSEQGDGVVTFGRRHWTVGTVVTVSIVVAAMLMILLQRWAFQAPVKWDLTARRINSLGSGTQAVLDSLDEETIHLTSLYLETDIETESQKKYRQAVNDLLRLYQDEKPGNIEIDWINPLKEQDKLSALLERIRERGRFEDETAAYRSSMQRFEQEVFGPFKQELHDIVAQLGQSSAGMPMAEESPAAGIERAVVSWIELGEKVLAEVQQMRSLPLPPYSTATQNISSFYDTVGEKIDYVVTSYADQQLQNPALSDAVKAILQEMKRTLQPWVARFTKEREEIQNLPPLSIDKLESALKQNNVVVVESSRGAKALSFDEVWPTLHEGAFAAAPQDYEQRRFAGEGAITPAILQLVQDQKTALVFVRYAGQRLFGMTGFGFNAQQGPLSALKEELERLNYMVKEWDVKESQERPTFEQEPKRIVYIVLRPGPNIGPQGMRTGEGMGPLERAAVLNAVSESGRALFLTGWEPFTFQYEYDEFLSRKWGIDADGQSLIVTAVPSAPGEWMLSRSFATVRDVKFAVHPSTTGLESLAGQTVFPLATPIRQAEETPEGVTVEPLAIAPATEDMWAVKDPQGFVQRFQREQTVAREPGDQSGPFTLALAASKEDAKIAVLASGEDAISDAVAVNNMLMFWNGRLQVRRQAPGNFALLANILHYLDDTLQWLNVGSPIDSSQLVLSDRQLTTWRVLSVGVFPALALLGGGLVWFVRRR